MDEWMDGWMDGHDVRTMVVAGMAGEALVLYLLRTLSRRRRKEGWNGTNPGIEILAVQVPKRHIW
jgi:hypothetical protein